jgi:MYXO-CTERM domain-containing protein
MDCSAALCPAGSFCGFDGNLWRCFPGRDNCLTDAQCGGVNDTCKRDLDGRFRCLHKCLQNSHCAAVAGAVCHWGTGVDPPGYCRVPGSRGAGEPCDHGLECQSLVCTAGGVPPTCADGTPGFSPDAGASAVDAAAVDAAAADVVAGTDVAATDVAATDVASADVAVNADGAVADAAPNDGATADIGDDDVALPDRVGNDNPPPDLGVHDRGIEAGAPADAALADDAQRPDRGADAEAGAASDTALTNRDAAVAADTAIPPAAPPATPGCDCATASTAGSAWWPLWLAAIALVARRRYRRNNR